MKSTSTAEAISAQLLALLPQHPAEATVHSVFHTSANLLYQGQLVTLLDDTRPPVSYTHLTLPTTVPV